MSQIIVRDTDKKKFFEKIIDHGVDHDFLTLEKRRELSEECARLTEVLCQRFELNIRDTGETGETASLLAKILAFKLEKESGGDVSKAVAVLSNQPVSQLVFSFLGEIERGARAVDETILKSSAVYKIKFGYNVNIARIDEREWFSIFGYREIERKSNIFRFIKTKESLREIDDWLAEVEEIKLEHEISKKFLPWDQLLRESEAKMASKGSEIQMSWTPSTLLATMTATFLCGGSNIMMAYPSLFGGTIFPANNLPIFKNTADRPDYFRQRGRGKLLEYLHKFKPVPDEETLQHIFKMWQKSMDNLLYLPAGVSSLAKLDSIAWAERMHLDYSFEYLNRKYLGREKTREKKTASAGQKNFIKEVLALKKADSGKTYGKLMSKLKWEDLTLKEFESLLRNAPPKIFAKTAALDTKTALTLIKRWENWPKKAKAVFLKRMVEDGATIVWMTLSKEEVFRLAEVFSNRFERANFITSVRSWKTDL